MRVAYTTQLGDTITLEPQALGKGGEGVVYGLQKTQLYNGYCVKLYEPKFRIPERYNKIKHMIAHKPSMLTKSDYTLCWPVDIVYENNAFAGFIMPRAENNNLSLYELCRPQFSQKAQSQWIDGMKKYDRATPVGIINRIKVCNNLAFAVYNIQSMKSYVFIDMKPQNFMFTNTGKIIITDLDSIQINNGQEKYHAAVATADYAPIEYSQYKINQHIFEETWDHFSLAVIFYQILFGVHPYTASFKGSYHNVTVVSDAISSGLFVHGPAKQHIETLPSPHSDYARVPKQITDLFHKTFVDGHAHPAQRTSTREWGAVFFEIAHNNTHIQLMPSPKSKPVSPGGKPVPVKRNVGMYIGIVMFVLFVIYMVATYATYWR